MLHHRTDGKQKQIKINKEQEVSTRAGQVRVFLRHRKVPHFVPSEDVLNFPMTQKAAYAARMRTTRKREMVAGATALRRECAL